MTSAGPGARRVVFVLPADLHLLDLAGPAQVFQTANDHGGAYDLHYVAEQTRVHTHQGIALDAATTWPRLEPADLLVLLGWRVGDAAVRVPFGADTLAAVVEHHDRGGTVASVCAGAFAIAESGLLSGRRATTHHDLQEQLRRRWPDIRVECDVLYVSDGRVHTSAGVASGIDLALHLVAGDHGPSVAARVARATVVHARRNGHAPQETAMLRHRDHLADVVHRAQDYIDEHFAEPVPLSVLAAHAAVSPRTLTRLFRTETDLTPLQYQQQLRVERADHLVAAGWTREAAAHEVGFTDARMLRRLTAS